MKEMRKKIFCFVVSMLVIMSAMMASILVTNTVKASGSPSNLPPNPINMSYVWLWTQKLANITYLYPHGEIPRGRAYGSYGANLSKDYIISEMHNNLSINNVHQEKIKHINGTLKDYTSIINVTDFQLTVNNPNCVPQNLSKNESFAIPSGYCPRTHNYNFTNVSMKFWNLTRKGLLRDLVNYSITNISDITLLNNNEVFVGNITYLAENASIPNESEQQGRIYVINNSAVSQSQLDNLTYASGCVIVNQSNKANYVVNATKCTYAVIEVNNADGLTMKNLSNNYSLVLADKENENLTLYYNISEGSLIHQKPYYVIVDRIPTHYELRSWWNASHAGIANYTLKYKLKNIAVYWLQFFSHKCVAFILYNTFDQHFMIPATFAWKLPPESLASPAIPTFTINNTVGEFLANNPSTTLSGYINQRFEQETPTQVGVTAYDITGYINPLNKNKKAVLSSRLDGWWGQTPGDSGCGNAVVLGIAKYIKDNNINPKYNLTILYTTGEEYGLRGAEYYSDAHKTDQIYVWFVIDELAFNQSDTVQEISIQNATGLNHWPILEAIIQDSHYSQRSGYANYNHSGPITGTEQAVYGSRNYIKDAICIAKDYWYEWDRYHSAGHHYTEGDSLKCIDRSDLNYSAELALNITKYWLMNPDCYFSTKQYEAVSSTGGTTPDTIKATFKVKSALPNDKVMINASFYDAASGLCLNHAMMNYTTNRIGIERNLTFTMPVNTQEGDYYVTLEVYNSTARINRIADTYYQGNENYHANDTDTSEIFHLNHYHTLGDIRIGTLTTNVHDDIKGSKFTTTEYAVVHNITAYIHGNNTPPSPTYQCMIYRFSDGHLMGNTTQVTRNQTGWYTFIFTPEPILRKNIQYVLSIWGDNDQAIIYSTYQSPANGYVNTSHTFGTPPQNITWNAQTLRQHSIFCRYTLDTSPPEITSVAHSPDTVGYGFNVTINATVTDNISGVNLVKVHITPPGGGLSVANYTMTHISGNLYRYIFTNTWVLGQYNYTIWAVDNASNVNSSTGHHFHVSVHAQISIATLNNTYTGDQYINLTDPPDPPENYMLVGRGLNWDKYYDTVTGQNVLEVSTGPINYRNESHVWTPINCTLEQLPTTHPAYTYGYRIGNDHGLYSVYLKPNNANDWPVAFAYNKSTNPTTNVIRSKLVGVGYIDPANNWAYHYLQNAQGSQGQLSDNTATYENVFPGTNVTWSYRNTEMKEAITMSNTTRTLLQNHPPSMYGLNNESSYLVFITKLDHQNLNMYNTSGVLTGNVTISDAGVEFKDALGQFKCALPLGEAYELNNETVREKLTYRIVHLNGNTYLLSGLKVSDLATMTFPVVIDPTLTVNASTSDGYLYNSGSNYNTVWSSGKGPVSSDEKYISIGQRKEYFPLNYWVYRGFLFFDTSELPANANIKNATLSLYKNDDYSATDFTITVQNGQPAYPNDPLEDGDYDKEHYSGNGGGLNTTNFVNGRNNITLSNLNWITAGGVTKLCLRSSRDINGNTPTQSEYVTVYATEQGDEFQPRLTIIYSNQSKIKNTGSTNFKGYLLIQVQYNESGTWVPDTDVVDETPPVWPPRTINISEQLALDKIFNGKIRASDLQHGFGTYRVYTAFRDPTGAILKTETGGGGVAELKAWWMFTYAE